MDNIYQKQPNIQIHYGPIKRSQYLDNFIKTGASKILGLTNDRSRRVQIWLRRESGLHSTGIPSFLVRVGFKKGRQPEQHVEAREKTLVASINNAIKKALQKFSENKRRYRERY